VSDVVAASSTGGGDPRVDRALRLFEFLGRVQQLKTKPPRTIDAYLRDGSVLWFIDLPEHPAVHSVHRIGEPEPEDVLLTIERVPRLDPPVGGEDLVAWLDGAIDDPDAPPALREQITFQDLDGEPDPVTGRVPSRTLALADPPDVQDQFDRWLPAWKTWAAKELQDRPVRELYGSLFSTYVAASGHPEELELVAGVGCLAWHPSGQPAVRRHVVTAPITISFDDDSGQLTVARTESVEAAQVELDMLDPGVVTNPHHIKEARAAARDLDSHPLHRDTTGALVRRIVQTLDAQGRYDDTDAPPQVSDDAVASFAPAIILRKRSQQGLVEIFSTIVEQITASGEVPDGLMPLVDPDHRPSTDSDPSDGALVMVDDDPFLPLPVNDVQLRIINQVDAKAQTLVQGPPGTGKTHTAAALVSHLLAQGKRVLITAHTDRALKEVRDKLPAAIRPLSVAVVGTSREDMSDLKVAVERIGATAAEHDPEAAAQQIQRCLERIDQLRRDRADLYRRLIEAREGEVAHHEHGPYKGTLASIAQQLSEQEDRYRWLTELATVPADAPSPLSDDEINEWRSYLLDEQLRADEQEAGQRLPAADALPSPEAFADLAAAETQARGAVATFGAMTAHAAFEALQQCDSAQRTALQQRLQALTDEADSLAGRHEAWMNDALSDVRCGRGRIWHARAEQVSTLIDAVTPLVSRLGPLTEVEVGNGDVAPLTELAKNLLGHLEQGGAVKTTADGAPKVGLLASKPVRHAQPLFDHVRINGLPPTTSEQLTAFLDWREGTRVLAALDRAWPEDVAIPLEDTLHERLQWHLTELEQLRRVLRLSEALEAEEDRLDDLGLPVPNWNDLQAVHDYAALVDAAAAHDALDKATAPLAELVAQLSEAARWADAAPTVHQLKLAVEHRDHDQYAIAHARLRRLEQVRDLVARRGNLGERLRGSAPHLAEAVRFAPDEPAWGVQLEAFNQAWQWAAASAWVVAQDRLDINALQAEVTFTDERIRREVETLSATRAWSHAVAPERIGGQGRADLEQYAFLVRKFGKGKSKYALQRKAEIRQSMDRCRPAVPVWIMPVYRIAEQLRVQPDMFDVVVVDEASQAGLEATFLQYLAPKIVVIGDDKQVSPTAVGVDQQQLRDLGAQYLADDPYRASWQMPERSLFDEAKMRFSGLLTLTEHRRCVPEIIGFSNRVAYEPDGIRLIPVRQYGADRLEPIVPVFLRDGYAQGNTNKINPVEVDAVVDRIEKCIADPRYDGLTFGVISLLGTAQAKAIEKELLERIEPEEWAARDLRCGDSADFQGSERDVMFLSMVAAAEPGKRLGALTRDLFVQRYNVAASRAKDQMWLFHSVALSDVGNPEDMRFQLLDYCYGVVSRREGCVAGALETQVSDNVRVDPFDSLFEQRVFNRLLDRGYTVVPQYPVEPYRLDLVVVGAKSRLAIECDGDTWHGPDSYERDLARQRDLERCGWQFFRIRESAFYVDPAGSLEALWETLEELEIYPSGWQPVTDREVNGGHVDGDTSAHTPATIPEHGPAVTMAAAGEVTPGTDRSEPAAAAPRPAMPDPFGATPSMRPMPQTVAPTADGSSEGYTQPELTVQQDDDGRFPAPSAAIALNPYEEFSGTVASLEDATRSSLVEGVLAVVAAEGPVMGHRLHSAYVKASGGQRVGKQIAKALNSAISAAARRGLLVEDNPLGAPGVKPRTFRLPTQPAVTLRELGPRSFEHIPPRELATLIAALAVQHGWDHEEALWRATLDALGLKRLTTNVTARLTEVMPLARQINNGETS
jgi:very-short-patch-repair endonuclease